MGEDLLMASFKYVTFFELDIFIRTRTFTSNYVVSRSPVG